MHSDPATACLDEEAIAKLVSGAGSATLLTEAEAHLTTCQRCQRVLADAAHAVRTTNHPVSRDSGAPPAFPSTWQGALAWLAPAGGPAASFGEASAALQEPSPAPPGSTGSSSLSPWARTPLPVGTVLAGRFRIVRFIARGGMGQVFEAEDRILGGRVALKTLRFASHAEPESIARFRREVALARSITHRNVCRVFDVGLHVDADSGNQTLFMTMELLTGETLSARVARVGRLSAEEALPIVLDMCAGLSAAHAGGVIHRDFKSGNVILHDGGDGSTRAVVTDFGLARLREAEGSLTEEGQLLGTPATMAPEQVLGERVSAATDIYALGCVLFEMMTGKLPFVGGNQFATANLRLTRPAPLLRTGAPRAPRSWESVVARCLERQPDKRFQTSAEVAVALQLAPPRARRWAGRGLLAGGVALGVCWMVWSNPVRSVATRVVQSLRSEESTAGFSVSSRPDEPSVRLSAEPVIAVLPLDNLSRRGDSDWLSMALREMLSTELASNEHLRVVPGDRVGRAVRDLGSAEAAALSEAGLGIVRASTAAEWVIHGGYTVVTAANEERLRIDLSFVDAQTGQVVTTVSSRGTTQELFELVTRVGAELRTRLRVPAVDARGRAEAHAAILEEPEAVRAYAEGLAFARALDLESAQERLVRVVELAPHYALGHSELANVYRLMGKDDLARKEAARALASSGQLSREAQLVVEARAHAASQEWEKAAEAYDTLFRFYPTNLSYGIQLARVVVNDGRPDDALAIIARLRKLPRPESEDPEIDIVEGIIATKKPDFERCRAVGQAALDKGRRLGAKSVIADGLSLLGEAEYHLGERAPALEHRLAAKQVFVELGDQRGIARSLDALGQIYFEDGDALQALKAQQEALGIARKIGHQYRVGGVLSAIGEIQESLGDLQAARRSFEESRATYRAMNEREGVGHTTTNLAYISMSEGDWATATQLLEEALAIHVAVGSRIGEGYEHIVLALVAQATGDLRAAREECSTGRQILEQVQDRETIAEALGVSSSISRDEGKFEAARQDAQAARDIFAEMGAKGRLADLELQLVRLSLDTGDLTAAERLASTIESDGRSTAMQRAMAEALRGRALAAQGDHTRAKAAAERALSAAGAVWDWAERTELRLAVVEQRARAGDVAAAAEGARQLEAEARSKGHVGLELEARAWLSRVEPPSALVKQRLLDTVAKKNYGRLRRLLATSFGSAP